MHFRGTKEHENSCKDSQMKERGFQDFSWDAVETVLLDMDGTLLDKYFDDYFWEHLLPEEYARKYSLDIREARHRLLSRFVTNAHYKTLDLKLKKNEIGKYFDSVICAFDIGLPKEDSAFWEKAAKIIRFNKETTMLVDDTENVLLSARAYGIRYLILKARPSSRGELRTSEQFPAITYFKELIRDD